MIYDVILYYLIKELRPGVSNRGLDLQQRFLRGQLLQRVHFAGARLHHQHLQKLLMRAKFLVQHGDPDLRPLPFWVHRKYERLHFLRGDLQRWYLFRPEQLMVHQLLDLLDRL